VLVGTRTQGKGRVQTMMPLPGNLGQINLSTSELLIGPDTPITRQPGSDAWGVDPHPGQEVLIPLENQGPLERLAVRAEVLQPAPSEQPQTAPASAPERKDEMYRQFIELDRQLARAVELLNRPERMSRILAAPPATRPAQTNPSTKAADIERD
jgi:hypothetical protein